MKRGGALHLVNLDPLGFNPLHGAIPKTLDVRALEGRGLLARFPNGLLQIGGKGMECLTIHDQRTGAEPVLGKRVVLDHFYPLPVDDARRIVLAGIDDTHLQGKVEFA